MAKKKRKQRPAARRQRGRAPGGPTMVTPEGDPLAFCTALYQHTGMDEVLQILSATDDFDLGDAPRAGPDGALQFGWYEMEPSRPPRPAPMGRRVLATVTLTPGTLLIETMSEGRLARGRRRLEQLLRHRLELVHTEVKSMAQMLAEEPSGDAPEPVILPPEQIADLEEQMLRRWIDDSIPALDGMTPREAVRTPEGRQMVLDLLDYIERQQASRPRLPGMFSPDYGKVKEMLGLA